MTRRRISLALAVLGVVLLTVGTGGFSSVDADRNVRIAVANDEHALLGVDERTPEPGNGRHRDPVVLFVVENQASSSQLDVTVLDVESAHVDDARGEGRPAKVPSVVARAGDTATEQEIVAKRIVCAANRANETRVTVRFRASTDGFSVQLERDVRISCSGNPDSAGDDADATNRTDTESSSPTATESSNRVDTQTGS